MRDSFSIVLTRRLALRLISRTGAGAGVALGLGPTARLAQGGAAEATALTPPVRVTLDSYLDTLIPGDSDSPGAVGAGAGHDFEAAAAVRQNVQQWLTEGSRWLDAQAHEGGAGSFAELDEAARNAIVARAAEAPLDSMERRFFEETRRAAYMVYYANPASWAALGFDGPPQPIGFPDYAEPPARRP